MQTNKIEIIANNSIKSDLFDALAALGLNKRYTLIPDVEGMGSCGGRLGTPIWPEHNFILILYVEDSQIEPLRRCCEKIKKNFPDEGLKLTSWKVDILL